MASQSHQNQRQRRQLPTLSGESLQSYHMTYKSSLDFMMKNQYTFKKATELMRQYPTLADHQSTEKLWELLSLGTIEKSANTFQQQLGAKIFKQMPKISITADDKNPNDVGHEFRDSRLLIGIIGLPSTSEEISKWASLVCGLTLESFVLSFKTTFEETYPDLSDTDGVVFLMTQHGIQNNVCLQQLKLVHDSKIPLMFVREPGFKLPQHVSESPSERVLLQPEIQSSKEEMLDQETVKLKTLPPISKSGYYITKINSSQTPHPNLSCLWKVLLDGYKKSLIYTRSNEEFCIKSILQSFKNNCKRLSKTPTPNFQVNENNLKTQTTNNCFENGITSNNLSSKRHNFAKGDTISDSSSTESEDSVIEVSSQKIELKKQDSIDDETIYVLFPSRDAPKPSSKPTYVKWPITETDSSELEDTSSLSDSSVGFQDVDLSETIIISDEEFAFT